MSMPFSNINAGGYMPPGYPNPSAPPPSVGFNPGPPPGNYGFVPGQQPTGYAPIPQMPPYGEVVTQYGVPQQSPYGGPQQHPYGGPQQPTYGGPQQPPYGGFALQPYDGNGYQPGNTPIITQPGVPGPPRQPLLAAGDWMSIPTGIQNCPRGLEYLTTLDKLLVKQKIELFEAISGHETNNMFTIKNSLGQKVYHAVEDNDCCTLNMCGSGRPFHMKIFDNFRTEVMHMYRPLACSICCFPVCPETIQVSAPPGNVIGTIEENYSICKPSYRIKNHIGDTVLQIEGPIMACHMGGNVEFNVMSLTGETVGKISKQWSSFTQEIFTDADFFGVSFPLDLDVRMKAVLLGATFLIDAIFFEN